MNAPSSTRNKRVSELYKITDKDEIIRLLRTQKIAFSKLDAKYRADEDIALAAINVKVSALKHASEEFKSDKKFIYKILDLQGYIINFHDLLKYVSEDLKDDKELVLAVLDKYPLCLIHASKRLKLDRDINLAAIDGLVICVDYGNEEFLNDKHFIIDALPRNEYILGEANDNLLDDLDVALAYYMLERIPNKNYLINRDRELSRFSERIKDLIEGKDPVDALTEEIAKTKK